MFLSILYVAVFLDVTYGGEYQCPIPSQILPCKCQGGYYGLTVSCGRVPVDQVRGPLAVVGKSKKPVLRLTLEQVQLPNLPSNLLVAPDVSWIHIKECNTSTVDENAFADVAATLVWLYITGNPLEQVPSQALQKLSKLTYLIMDDNRIQVLQAEAFKGLHSLEELSLRGNRIKLIDDSAFEGIGITFAIGSESLRRLILSNNAIKNIPSSVFRPLKKLLTLNLTGNVIDSIHPLAFEGIEDTLGVLKLGYNRLEEIPAASLKNLKRLHSINLSGNDICKVRKDDFQPYGKTLAFIYLQKNSLTHVDPEAFIGLDALRWLSLQSNQLNAAPFETYSPVLDTLRTFDIHDNPLHCDCNLSWLANWINGNGSGVVEFANETSCSTPEQQRKKLLTTSVIPSDQLVCGDSTPKPSKTCTKRVTNAQGRHSSVGFTTVLQLGFILLITALF